MAKKQTESKTMDNQTLEKLKRIYNQADSFGKELMEKEFPELKESEDERIRKTLIELIKGITSWNYFLGISKKQMVSWLEKQSEQKPADKVEPKFKVGDTIINKYFRWDGNRRIREITDGKYIFDDGSYINIKEQDEWKLDEWILCLENKPKFKVGDWVVRNYTNHDKIVNKVINVKQIDETYGYKLDDGTYFSGSFEREYHLWTIQDANDGDVLASNHSIFIFSQEYMTGKPEAHCGIMNGLFLAKPEGCWTNEKCYPTIKEQRDTLMKAIANAGYIFDFEKRELKKIRQKYVECKQETKPNGGIVYEDFNDGDGYYKINLKYLSKLQVELIENLVASWQNPTNNTVKLREDKNIMS